jgi:hypothetical protein
MGLVDVQRAAGSDESHRHHFALFAVDDRLDQQGRDRGCALDARLAFGRLGLRDERRGGGGCRREG